MIKVNVTLNYLVNEGKVELYVYIGVIYSFQKHFLGMCVRPLSRTRAVLVSKTKASTALAEPALRSRVMHQVNKVIANNTCQKEKERACYDSV